MRKAKFSDTHIVGILKDFESRAPVVDLVGKRGGCKATFVKWLNKYGGATVMDLKRLRILKTENGWRKRGYADFVLIHPGVEDGFS